MRFKLIAAYLRRHRVFCRIAEENAPTHAQHPQGGTEQ
jgi:hypothetical protein